MKPVFSINFYFVQYLTYFVAIFLIVVVILIISVTFLLMNILNQSQFAHKII